MRDTYARYNLQMDINTGFLTPQEVAEQLKLNLLTIYSYIRSKKLRASRFGRKYRIDSRDLKDFILEHRIN